MTAPARQQAIHACDFWTGLEYMNLVAVPDPDEKRHVFRIDADADLPWVHPGRTRSLAERARRYKAQVAYCGLFGKGAYTAALRADLGAGALPVRDLPRGEAATLLLPLDDTGRVCGEPFVSSLPWLMGRLRGHLASGAPAGQLDLRGFDAFQAGLLVELRQLLVRLQLVPEEELRAREPQGREDDAAAARPRADKVCGSPDMNPLAMRDVRELLSLVWTRCGWNPPGWCEAEAAGDDLHLVRIKVVPMTRHVDRAVDLGALNSLVAADVMRVRARLASDAEEEAPHWLRSIGDGMTRTAAVRHVVAYRVVYDVATDDPLGPEPQPRTRQHHAWTQARDAIRGSYVGGEATSASRLLAQLETSPTNQDDRPTAADHRGPTRTL